MKEVLLINPPLIKRLLESPIDSKVIAKNTGINLQQIRSYRKEGEQMPLVPLEEMRLKLASELTLEAQKYDFLVDKGEYLTKEDIYLILHHPLINDETLEEETGIKLLMLNVARSYAKDDEKIGMIRLGTITKLLVILNQ